MLVDEMIDELKTVAELAGRIEGGLEFSALMNSGKLPQHDVAAFVFSAGFDAGPSKNATGVHHQTVTERLAVALIVASPDDPTGVRVRTKVENIVQSLINHLAGVVLPSAADVLDVVRGRLAEMSGGRVFYEVHFSTTWHLRKTS